MGDASWFAVLVPTWIVIAALMGLTVYVAAQFRRCRFFLFLVWSMVFWIPLTVCWVRLG